MSVPHLNELHEKYERAGLSIVGVTDEPKDKTEPWIDAHHVEYGYAYDTGAKLRNALQVKAYPTAVLVDPDGTVVWSGSPFNLQKSLIEEHLRGASRTPVIAKSWPDSAKPVVTEVTKECWGAALQKARDLADDDASMQPVVSDLERYVGARLTRIDALRQQGDYMRFVAAAEPLAKVLEGTPEGDGLSKQLDEIDGNRDTKNVIRAQQTVEKVRKMADDARHKRDIQRLIAQLDQLAEKNADNFAGKEASELSAKLAKQAEQMDR